MRLQPIFLSLCIATSLTACGKGSKDKSKADAAGQGKDAKAGESKDKKSQMITIDGSSTVYPITEAVAEEFRDSQKDAVRVTIGVSGTGGGFKKFCNNETVISGASRPIKPSEVEMCKKNGVEYIELPIAYDGITVVVNPKNDWAKDMTIEELKTIWAPEAQNKITKWNQVRPDFPDKEIHLFGPGVDSGTYDYFTKAIVGKEHSSRGDFTSSEDDNVLVKGISSDELALGFFGYAYYAENKDKLNVVPISDGKDDNGAGAITPSVETVANGTYQPLSRPIFIYVSKAAAQEQGVKDFVNFYITNAPKLTGEVGYIPLPPQAYTLLQNRFDNRVTGSLFAGKGSKVGVTVEDLLAGG